MTGRVTIAIDQARELLDLMHEFRRNWSTGLTPVKIAEVYGEDEGALAARVDDAILTLAAAVVDATPVRPAREWPFLGHRTMAQVMADEGGAA